MTTKEQILEPELAGVVKETGIEPASALVLQSSFSEFFGNIKAILDQAGVVTDPEDKEHQVMARSVRLGLKGERVRVEKARKAMKKDSLTRGKAIDGFANVLKYMCEPTEAAMLEIEEHAARKVAAEKAKITAERTAELEKIGADPALYQLDKIDYDAFSELLVQIIQAQELQAKAEADAQVAREAAELADAEARKAQEKADAEARAKIEAENKALAEKNAKLEAENKAAAQKVDQEKRARQAAEAQAEIVANEARVKAERAEIEAEQVKQAALAAPDKAKIEAFAKAVTDLRTPSMSTPEGCERMLDIMATQVAFGNWILAQNARL